MTSWWDTITAWWSRRQGMANAFVAFRSAVTESALKEEFDALPQTLRDEAEVQHVYVTRMKTLRTQYTDPTTVFEDFIKGALDSWLVKVAEYGKADPAKAKENLSKLSAHVIEVAAASAAIDVGLGMLPNSAGTASATNTKQLLAWLGFGAVLAAVAHDPVKIGLLRPYQDSLEQTFRNRRPDDFALFQAYRTRELTPTKVEDLALLDDTKMSIIEGENDRYYNAEIAKWGYSEWFAGALARSATRTLGFSQLVTLARAGIYDKGLAIYSLWGEGLDRVVMPAALSALETLRDREMYSGFRSMIEPSFVDGDITEAELREYWTLSGVPAKVQDWVIVRLRKRRDKTADVARRGTQTKERDLTVSQITQAYQSALIKRVDAYNAITALGYSGTETDILLNLAEVRKTTTETTTLKRLSLSDYEKAYKAKLISLDAVLLRMQGEYAAVDIELEKQLLIAGKA